jgi:hypothetical protein
VVQFTGIADVNKELYFDNLCRLREAVRRQTPEKWRINSWFLFYDNAAAHRSVFVKPFLAKNNVAISENPQVSPGLAAAEISPVTLTEIGIEGTALM